METKGRVKKRESEEKEDNDLSKNRFLLFFGSTNIEGLRTTASSSHLSSTATKD